MSPYRTRLAPGLADLVAIWLGRVPPRGALPPARRPRSLERRVARVEAKAARVSAELAEHAAFARALDAEPDPRRRWAMLIARTQITRL